MTPILESHLASKAFYLTFNEIDSLFQSVGICVAIIQNQGSCKRVDGRFFLLIRLRLYIGLLSLFFLSRKMSFFGPLEKRVFRVGTFKNSICQFDSALNIVRFILESSWFCLPTTALWPLWTLDKFDWLFC